jgi:hypothetical protein
VEPAFRSYAPMLTKIAQRHLRIAGVGAQSVAGLSEAEAALLARHASYGCLSLVCRAADDRGFAFVLQPICRIPNW